MWSFFSSLLWQVVGWIFRVGTVKFVMLWAVFFVIQALAGFVLSALGAVDFSGIPSLVEALPEGLLYYLELFKLHVGLPLVFAAYVARFVIRRIPFIG